MLYMGITIHLNNAGESIDTSKVHNRPNTETKYRNKKVLWFQSTVLKLQLFKMQIGVVHFWAYEGETLPWLMQVYTGGRETSIGTDIYISFNTPSSTNIGHRFKQALEVIVFRCVCRGQGNASLWLLRTAPWLYNSVVVERCHKIL